MNYDLTCKVLRCTVLSLCIYKAVETPPLRLPYLRIQILLLS